MEVSLENRTFSPKKKGRKNAVLTEVVDQHASDHGPAASPQTQVQALQDALRRRPQLGGHRGAQVGDAGRPDGRVRHACGGRGQHGEQQLRLPF